MPHQTDQQRQTPTCRFFATQAGCRAGADCRFAHIALVSNDKGTENHALSSPPSLNSGKASVSTEAVASTSAGMPSRSLEGTNAIGEQQAATQPSRYKKGPRRAERNDHDNSFNSKLDLQPFDMDEPAPQAHRGGRRGGRWNGNPKSSPSNRQGNQGHSNPESKRGKEEAANELNQRKRTPLGNLAITDGSQLPLDLPPERAESKHVSIPTQQRVGRGGVARLAVSRPSVKSLAIQDPKKAQQAARASELEQLERRFRSSHNIIISDNEKTVVQIALPPSDPDFPFELEALLLNITVPTGYPSPESLCSVQVMNTKVPVGFARNLEKGFDAYVAALASPPGTQKTLLQQLHWLDKNMEQLLQQPPAATMRFVRNSDRSSDSVALPLTVTAAEPPAYEIVPPAPKSAPTPPISRAPLRSYTKQQLEEASVRRTQELKQVENRFRMSYKVIRTTLEETALRLTVLLSDPEFAFKSEVGDTLELEIIVPAVYPLEPCVIRVLNDGVEEWRKRNIADGFLLHVVEASTSSGPAAPSIFQHLNWLDRNLENLMQLPCPESLASKLAPHKVEAEQHTEIGKVPEISIFRDDEYNKEGSSSFKKKVVIVERSSNEELTRLEVSAEDNNEMEEEDEEEEGEDSNDSYTDTESENDNVEGDSIAEDLFDSVSNTSRQPTMPSSVSSSSSQSQLQSQEARRGTELRLPNIKLDNVALLYCSVLNLLVRCARCKGTMEMRDIVPEFDAGLTVPEMGVAANFVAGTPRKNEKWLSCPTCTSLVGVRLKGELVHEHSSVLGLLQLAGCAPFDLLPSTYQPTCLQCVSATPGTPQPPLKNVVRDQPITTVCRNCHARMTIHLTDLKFVRLGVLTAREKLQVSEVEVSKLKRKKRQAGKELGIVVGQPLPHRGTCKHYQKSFRWFRFPCCGKLYPCDICHDDAEDHDHELARKIVCGFCAREQGVTGKAVCVCGADLVKTYGKGFWEGGQGVREQSLMNRNDSRKGKGTKKTVSKKEQRVGAAGKRAIAEKEWLSMASRGIIPAEK